MSAGPGSSVGIILQIVVVLLNAYRTLTERFPSPGAVRDLTDNQIEQLPSSLSDLKTSLAEL